MDTASCSRLLSPNISLVLLDAEQTSQVTTNQQILLLASNLSMRWSQVTNSGHLWRWANEDTLQFYCNQKQRIYIAGQSLRFYNFERTPKMFGWSSESLSSDNTGLTSSRLFWISKRWWLSKAVQWGGERMEARTWGPFQGTATSVNER